jgi:hypothetical protein
MKPSPALQLVQYFFENAELALVRVLPVVPDDDFYASLSSSLSYALFLFFVLFPISAVSPSPSALLTCLTLAASTVESFKL